MIPSCRLEAMLVAGSCHRYGRCYRNSSSHCPPCCGNYRVAASYRRAQLDLNKTTCVCVCVCVWLFLIFYSLCLNKQAGKSSPLNINKSSSSADRKKHQSSDIPMLELHMITFLLDPSGVICI